MLNFPKISRDKAGWLEQPFDEAESFGVVKDFNGYKAPGLDSSYGLLSNLLGHF